MALPLHSGNTAHPIHFDDLSGPQFERLVFAFLIRRWPWQRLEWYGQGGTDGGRDIVGIRETDMGNGERVVIACANYKRLTKAKVLGDIDAIAKRKPRPDYVLIVAGGGVSATVKDAAGAHASKRGMKRTEVWSGQEFEVHLRHHAEALLRRIFGGEEVPDDPLEIHEFIRSMKGTEAEALALIGRFFERPAFTTPFSAESSLQDFKRAISDTIDAINTGIHRARDGTIVARYPSRHDFASPATRASLAGIVTMLTRLRMEFDRRIADGSIELCPSGHFHLKGGAAHAMDSIRRDIQMAVHDLMPTTYIDFLR